MCLSSAMGGVVYLVLPEKVELPNSYHMEFDKLPLHEGNWRLICTTSRGPVCIAQGKYAGDQLLNLTINNVHVHGCELIPCPPEPQIHVGMSFRLRLPNGLPECVNTHGESIELPELQKRMQRHGAILEGTVIVEVELPASVSTLRKVLEIFLRYTDVQVIVEPLGTEH